MRKIALIAGCSHTAGCEIDGQLDSRYNRENSYGALLARKLGYEPVNIAISGSSNTGIARSIQRWFSEQYDPSQMEVFVIVGWTECNRLEVPANDIGQDYCTGNNFAADWYDTTAGDYYRVNLGWLGANAYEKSMVPGYHRFMVDNPRMLELWSINQILLIQYFLKSINIPYLMCHTMHLLEQNDHYTPTYLKMVDTDHYYNLTATYEGTFFTKYQLLGHKNTKAKYGHHNEEPHKLFAEELYKFIKEKQDV